MRKGQNSNKKRAVDINRLVGQEQISSKGENRKDVQFFINKETKQGDATLSTHCCCCCCC